VSRLGGFTRPFSGFQLGPLDRRGGNLISCPAFVYKGLGPVAACARVLVHEVLDRGTHAAFLVWNEPTL
jgi:hypothetical protein